MWLYVHGGIYLDLDFEIQRPFAEIFSQNSAEVYLIPSGNVSFFITNSFMASKPFCEFWLKVIQRAIKGPPWWCLGKHMKVMGSTGSLAITGVYLRERVCEKKFKIEVLSKSLFMPLSAYEISHPTVETEEKLNYAILKPLVGGTWTGTDTFLYNQLWHNKGKI
jgi:mannosyltransferase OCH1-like enzyme